MSPSTTPQRRRPGLERLMAAADELLYSEGIRSTGVARILEHSGVARGTLYGNFESKDELVEAYLERRHEETMAAIEHGMATVDTADPGAVFDALLDVGEERSGTESFRGCAFALAVAEMPEEAGPAKRWATTHKSAVKALLAAPLDGRADDPQETAEELMVLYDGAMLASALRPGAGSYAAARRTGHAVIAAALAPS